MNRFTVRICCFAVHVQLLLTFILKPLGALATPSNNAEGKVPAELYSEYTSLTQTEEREIYEIHMFNTFHFVQGICIAYHSILGSKHSV